MLNRKIETIGIMKSFGKQVPGSIMMSAGSTVTGNVDCDNLLYSDGVIEIGELRIETSKILWDTGASKSVLYIPDCESKIGSQKSDSPYVFYAASGELIKVDTYNGTIALSDGFKISGSFAVIDADPTTADAIIGMDVILRGKFTVDGKKNSFAFEI